VLDDRPSILLGLLRVILGAGAIAVGVEQLVRPEDALTNLADLEAGTQRALAVAAILAGGVLLIGLLPRLAAFSLLVVIVVVAVADTGLELDLALAPPLVAALLLLVLVVGGGGRFALIDRLDPAPPRRLVRES